MVFEHDFAKFPELTNSQLETLRFVSPHQQIEEDFSAVVVKVHDGDTVTLRTDFRDFDFSLRLSGIDAPEMNDGGEKARDWLRGQVLGESVDIKINRDNRVGKFGRLIGSIIFGGMDMGAAELRLGLVSTFAMRREGELPNLDKDLGIDRWL